MGIAGDPDVILDGVDAITDAARSFTDVADAVGSHGRAVTAFWEGSASEAAGTAIAVLSRRTRVGHDVLTPLARVLRTYAAALRAAQQDYDDAAARSAAAAIALGAAQTSVTAAAAMPTTDAAGGYDPVAVAAQGDAAGNAASAVTSAQGDLDGANADMAAAVSAAEQANTDAARDVDALTDQLTDMSGLTTASFGGGGSFGDGHGAEHDDWWHNTVGGIGEGLWAAGPGLVGEVLGWSTYGGGKQIEQGITAAHDWLVDWWGADTDDDAYHLGDGGGTVASMFFGGGELRLGVKAGETVVRGVRGIRGAKVAAEGVESAGGAARALTAAESERLAALPSRYRELDVVTAPSGSKGAWTRELNNPQPNTVYLVDDRHAFVTDSQSRVVHAASELQYRPPSVANGFRSGYRQRIAGGGDRLEFDQGGHLVAASLGGPGEGINLVAMNKELNGAANAETWGAMESELRKILKNDPNAKLEFKVKINYDATSGRPSKFRVDITHDGIALEPKRFINES